MSQPNQDNCKLAVLHAVVERGGKARTAELHDAVAKLYPGLTDKDKLAKYSRGDSVFKVQVRYARQKLQDDGCLRVAGASWVWGITRKGKALYAKEWPSWKPQYHKVKVEAAPAPAPAPAVGTGEHALVEAAESHHSRVKHALLLRVRALTGRQCEFFVADVLEATGQYGSQDDGTLQVTPATNDGGVDIISTLSTGTVVISVKNQAAPVGDKDVREFRGAMSRLNVGHGKLVSTSGFTTGLEDKWKADLAVHLVPWETLAVWCLRGGVGVREVTSVPVYKINDDFFQYY